MSVEEIKGELGFFILSHHLSFIKTMSTTTFPQYSAVETTLSLWQISS